MIQLAKSLYSSFAPGYVALWRKQAGKQDCFAMCKLGLMVCFSPTNHEQRPIFVPPNKPQSL